MCHTQQLASAECAPHTATMHAERTSLRRVALWCGWGSHSPQLAAHVGSRPTHVTGGCSAEAHLHKVGRLADAFVALLFEARRRADEHTCGTMSNPRMA